MSDIMYMFMQIFKTVLCTLVDTVTEVLQRRRESVSQ